MSRNGRRAVVIGLAGIVVFGLAANLLAGYQKRAKVELLSFLALECGIERDLVDAHGVLTREAVAAVREDLGDWRDKKKNDLWDRFRYADYWLSVLRTLFTVSLFIVFFVGARAVLARITISKSLYGKFRPLPPEEERKDEKDHPPRP
jgi:hypothetical protein